MKQSELGIASFGPLDRVQKILFSHRFGQEIQGAGLHGAHARRNIALTGDKYDRSVRTSVGKRLLECKAVEVRHRNVQHSAAGCRGSVPFEEFSRGYI